MAIFVAIIIGLVIGSFLNALIFRLKSGESILFRRSHCMRCAHELAPWDLIPVLSFLLLRGRCRYCKKKISGQYPAIELATALAFVLLAINSSYQLSLTHFWIPAVFISFLIVIAVFDLKYYLILDKVIFPAFVLALINSIFQGHFVSSLLGAGVVSEFFLLQYLLSRGRWIGLGDVKLGLFLGSMSGLGQGLALLVVAYGLGAAAGVLLIALGRKKLSSRMPFGAFLGLSGIIIILYGDKILSWYMKLIGI